MRLSSFFSVTSVFAIAVVGNIKLSNYPVNAFVSPISHTQKKNLNTLGLNINHDNEKIDGVTVGGVETRRTFLSFVPSSILLSSAATTIISKDAWADVSDGNALPEGAARFSRVLKAKTDWMIIGKRVRENAGDIDDKEWEAIDDYLRVLYRAGEDMKVMSDGIPDESRRKKAAEDASNLQKYVRAGDVTATKQDAKGFNMIYDNSMKYIDDFFDQLSDVPDEI